MGELLADLAVDLIPGQVGRQEGRRLRGKSPSRWDTQAFLCYLTKTIQEEAEWGRVRTAGPGLGKRVCFGDGLTRHEALPNASQTHGQAP